MKEKEFIKEMLHFYHLFDKWPQYQKQTRDLWGKQARFKKVLEKIK